MKVCLPSGFSVWILNFHLFIQLFLAVLGLPCWADFSLVVAPLYLWYTGFSLQWLLLLLSVDSRMCGLQQLKLLGSRSQAQQLWFMALVAPQHVESSQTKDRNCVSCIGGRFFISEPQGKLSVWIFDELYVHNTWEGYWTSSMKWEAMVTFIVNVVYHIYRGFSIFTFARLGWLTGYI